MQRIRIGLTGLAFVFVLVLLATALVRPTAEAPLTENQIEQQRAGRAAPANNVEQPEEPLAQLGVTPGNAETNNAAEPVAPPAR